MRLAVPSGWCLTSGAGPAPPPAPAITSLVRTSTWISRKPIFAAQHGLEAAMWRRTAARLRNRPLLESCPVSLHLGHSDSESWRRLARGRYSGSTCHDCHCDQQESRDGPRHCISCHRLGLSWFARADPALKLVCTRTSLRLLGPA